MQYCSATIRLPGCSLIDGTPIQLYDDAFPVQRAILQPRRTASLGLKALVDRVAHAPNRNLLAFSLESEDALMQLGHSHEIPYTVPIILHSDAPSLLGLSDAKKQGCICSRSCFPDLHFPSRDCCLLTARILHATHHRRASRMQKLIMACKEVLTFEQFEKLKKRVPGTLKLQPRTSGRSRRG